MQTEDFADKTEERSSLQCCKKRGQQDMVMGCMMETEECEDSLAALCSCLSVGDRPDDTLGQCPNISLPGTLG